MPILAILTVYTFFYNAIPSRLTNKIGVFYLIPNFTYKIFKFLADHAGILSWQTPPQLLKLL